MGLTEQNAQPQADLRSQTRKALALGGVAGVLAAITEARTAYETVTGYYTRWQDRSNWPVTIASDDPLYKDVVAWLDSLVVGEERKSLVLRSDGGNGLGKRSGNSESVPVSDSESRRPKRQLFAMADQHTVKHVVVKGHRIKAYVNSGEKPSKNGDVSFWEPDKLTFICASREAQAALVTKLDELLEAREKSDRQPTIRILEPRWNSWRYRGDLPPRPIESVVLRKGQLERIVEDLGSFLESEDVYNERALPWHRGYLFEGPPGTGKTSLARALASHFGMDLWYAPLGDVKDDSSLLSLLAEVHPRSMVLLEDVDVFAATHEREAENTQHVTLSGLLNALDGVATPHGLVTVMTTNQPKALDVALTRAGRMDVVETLLLPNVDQATRLFEAFYKEAPKELIVPNGKSTAELLELFKANMHDPYKAWLATRIPK